MSLVLADKSSRIFVTVPRFQIGIPATLTTVTKNKFQGNPKLRPYPSWSWHQNSASCNRDRLISVFRVQVTYILEYVVSKKMLNFNKIITVRMRNIKNS